jgi:GNAT superfamily N-acetyltransferase
MQDNGWRTTKYGGKYNIYWTKNDYMNARIKSKQKKTNTKIEKAHTDILGEEKYLNTLRVNGLAIGQLDYHYKGKTPVVDFLSVHPDYRRKGYATMIMKDFQKQVGDVDIDFDFLTKDNGLPLMQKIATFTEIKEDQFGGKHYKGRIKL